MPATGRATGREDRARRKATQRSFECRWTSLCHRGHFAPCPTPCRSYRGSQLSHMLKGREKVAGFDTAAHKAAFPIKCTNKHVSTWSSYWYSHIHRRPYSMTWRTANTTLWQAQTNLTVVQSNVEQCSVTHPSADGFISRIWGPIKDCTALKSHLTKHIDPMVHERSQGNMHFSSHYDSLAKHRYFSTY